MDEFSHITEELEVIDKGLKFRFNTERCAAIGERKVPKAENFELFRVRRAYHFNKGSSDHVVLTIPNPEYLVLRNKKRKAMHKQLEALSHVQGGPELQLAAANPAINVKDSIYSVQALPKEFVTDCHYIVEVQSKECVEAPGKECSNVMGKQLIKTVSNNLGFEANSSSGVVITSAQTNTVVFNENEADNTKLNGNTSILNATNVVLGNQSEQSNNVPGAVVAQENCNSFSPAREETGDILSSAASQFIEKHSKSNRELSREPIKQKLNGSRICSATSEDMCKIERALIAALRNSDPDKLNKIDKVLTSTNCVQNIGQNVNEYSNEGNFNQTENLCNSLEEHCEESEQNVNEFYEESTFTIEQSNSNETNDEIIDENCKKQNHNEDRIESTETSENCVQFVSLQENSNISLSNRTEFSEICKDSSAVQENSNVVQSGSFIMEETVNIQESMGEKSTKTVTDDSIDTKAQTSNEEIMEKVLENSEIKQSGLETEPGTQDNFISNEDNANFHKNGDDAVMQVMEKTENSEVPNNLELSKDSTEVHAISEDKNSCIPEEKCGILQNQENSVAAHLNAADYNSNFNNQKCEFNDEIKTEKGSSSSAEFNGSEAQQKSSSGQQHYGIDAFEEFFCQETLQMRQNSMKETCAIQPKSDLNEENGSCDEETPTDNSQVLQSTMEDTFEDLHKQSIVEETGKCQVSQNFTEETCQDDDELQFSLDGIDEDMERIDQFNLENSDSHRIDERKNQFDQSSCDFCGFSVEEQGNILVSNRKMKKIEEIIQILTLKMNSIGNNCNFSKFADESLKRIEEVRIIAQNNAELDKPVENPVVPDKNSHHEVSATIEEKGTSNNFYKCSNNVTNQSSSNSNHDQVETTQQNCGVTNQTTEDFLKQKQLAVQDDVEAKMRQIFKQFANDSPTKMDEEAVNIHASQENDTSNEKSLKESNDEIINEENSSRRLRNSTAVSYFSESSNDSIISEQELEAAGRQTHSKENVNHDRKPTGNSNKKIFACDQCSFKVKKESHLKVHLRMHILPYRCNVCLDMFAHTEGLQQHVKQQHNYYGEKRKTVADENSGEEPFQANNRKPYKCGFCDYATSYINRMQYHMKVHKKEKLYECDKCSFSTLTEWMIKRHLRNHSNKQKLFECGECGYITMHQDDLELHQRIHSGKKLYRCNICSFSTAHAGYFNAHRGFHNSNVPKEELLSENESETKYKCEECNYSTWQRSTLEKHAKKFGHVSRSASPKVRQNRLTCSECRYVAPSYMALRRHLTNHHNLRSCKFKINSTGLALVCAKCNIACVTHKDLTEHTTKVHRRSV